MPLLLEAIQNIGTSRQHPSAPRGLAVCQVIGAGGIPASSVIRILMLLMRTPFALRSRLPSLSSLLKTDVFGAKAKKIDDLGTWAPSRLDFLV